MTWVDGIINLIKLFCFVFATGAMLYLLINYWHLSNINQKNKLKMDIDEIKNRVNNMPLSELVKLNNAESDTPSTDPTKSDKPT